MLAQKNMNDEIDLKKLLSIARMDYYFTHGVGIALIFFTMSMMLNTSMIILSSIVAMVVVYQVFKLASKAAASGEIIEETKEKLKES